LNPEATTMAAPRPFAAQGFQGRARLVPGQADHGQVRVLGHLVQVGADGQTEDFSSGRVDGQDFPRVPGGDEVF